MEEDELRRRIECAECGDLVEELDPSFPLPDGMALCFECAIRRGGQYDSERDNWSAPPDLSELPGVTLFREPEAEGEPYRI